MKVGIGQFEILGFSPTKEKLNRLLGSEKITKEIEYSDGDSCKIVVVLKEVGDKFITFATFNLKKHQARSKANNYAFYNRSGDIRWGRSENDLPSTFYLDGEVYPVYEGQEGLLDLLKCSLKRAEGNGLVFDTKRWWEGNFSELNNLEFNTLGASVVIESFLEDKQKNKAWTKKFCPGSQTERFRNQVYGLDYLKTLRKQDLINKDKEAPKENKRFFEDWEKLLLLQNDPLYPCPYFFYNGYLKIYVPTDNPINDNKRVIK